MHDAIQLVSIQFNSISGHQLYHPISHNFTWDVEYHNYITERDGIQLASHLGSGIPAQSCLHSSSPLQQWWGC
uniref:Uncharacterized protein n=1 Tax=Aegilops tauschii subsp. strangulata TaxID=200361 RepID=A0A453IDP9_AEGTS